jgi:hypothetical protein
VRHDDGTALVQVVARSACQVTAVWDWQRSQLLLAFNSANYSATQPFAANMQMFSHDLGETFTRPTSNVRFLGRVIEETGPGLGLQLSPRHPTHPGRILFVGSKFIHTHEGFAWYSDDGGESYEVSNTSWVDTNEAQLVELPDGRVMANLRYQGTPCTRAGCPPGTTARADRKFRLTAVSRDAGGSFGPLSWERQLPGPNCYASILRPPGGTEIFFSNPANQTQRWNGLIRKSSDGAKTWEATALRVTDPATPTELFSYSCLSTLPGVSDRLGILWEKGLMNDGAHLNLTHIVFSTFAKDFGSREPVAQPAFLKADDDSMMSRLKSDTTAVRQKHDDDSTPVCSCANASLCKPLAHGPAKQDIHVWSDCGGPWSSARHEGESNATGGDCDWSNFPWNNISTIVRQAGHPICVSVDGAIQFDCENPGHTTTGALTTNWPDSPLVCQAHAHDVRVLAAVLPNHVQRSADPLFYQHLMGNETAVQRMADNLAHAVAAAGYDGISFVSLLTTQHASLFLLSVKYADIDACRILRQSIGRSPTRRHLPSTTRTPL